MRSGKQAAVDLLVLQVSAAIGIGTPVRELPFAKTIGRRWRFDVALPAFMVAAEVDGGVFVGGRHTRGAGVEADCRKLGAAVELGWLVVRGTPRLVKSGEMLRWIEAAVEQRKAAMG